MSPSFAIARARWTIALSTLGIDPCPDVPRATSRMPRDTFSVVATPTKRTRSPFISIVPPSFSANSAAILSQWFWTT